MKKDEYLKASFDNVQSLIQFSDQKVAAVLVVVTITTSIFVSQIDNLSLSIIKISLLDVLLFITGFSFCILNTIILYIGLIQIIRPSFAKHYSGTEFSLYYFEHVANADKNKYLQESNQIDQKRMEKELADQLYEVSKILRKKSIKCNKIINLLFMTIVILFIFCILKKTT